MTPREPRIDAAKLDEEYAAFVSRLGERYAQRLQKTLDSGDSTRITDFAVRMIGDHRKMLVYGYAAGVDLEELSAAAAEVSVQWERLFGLLQEHGPHSRNPAQYLDLSTPGINEYFGVSNLVSLLLGLGRRDDARRILELPAVAQCDDVVLQLFREQAGAAPTPSPQVSMPKAGGPWVAVRDAAPEQRSAALTAYAKGWAASWGLDEPVRATPAFCFDIVPLVLALEIEDSAARAATPDYPADLVDHGRAS